MMKRLISISKIDIKDNIDTDYRATYLENYSRNISLISRLGVIVLITIMVTLFFRVPGMLIDNIILQSKYVPRFTKYFTDNYGSTYHIKPMNGGIDKKNLVINSLKSKNIGGLSIEISSDGALLMNGTYSGEPVYLKMSPPNFFLSEGSYIISLGNELKDKEKCKFYIEGWNTRGIEIHKELLGMTATKEKFLVEEGEFDQFWYGICIQDGFCADNEMLFPMIVSAMWSPYVDKYIPAPTIDKIDDEQIVFRVYYVPKEELLQLEHSEIKAIINSLRYQFRGQYKYCTIVVDDGTGIQFQEDYLDLVAYGRVDSSGRINELFQLTDFNTILSLISGK